MKRMITCPSQPTHPIFLVIGSFPDDQLLASTRLIPMCWMEQGQMKPQRFRTLGSLGTPYAAAPPLYHSLAVITAWKLRLAQNR
jgi:hypothetical protein